MLEYKVLEPETKKILAVAKCCTGVTNAIRISKLEYSLIIIALVARNGNENSVRALMEGLI